MALTSTTSGWPPAIHPSFGQQLVGGWVGGWVRSWVLAELSLQDWLQVVASWCWGEGMGEHVVAEVLDEE